MKSFEIQTKLGWLLEVGVEEEPIIRESTGDKYDKEFRIASLKIDGVEVPKNKHGILFSLSFGYFPVDKVNKLTILVEYDVFKFIKELKKFKTKDKAARILCSDELVEYYENVLIPAADRKIEEMKTEKVKKVTEVFQALKDEDILQISFNTSTGYCICGEYGRHEFFRDALKAIKSAGLKLDDSYITESDYGDYSISYTYSIPYKDFKELYARAKPVADEKVARASEEKQRKDELQQSLKMEILKQGNRGTGESRELYANVKLTDPSTGESLTFSCRNIFDVGYTINPGYAIAEGIEGGLSSNGKWKSHDNEKGWYEVRDLTDFEKKCIEYLCEFPPISTKIRM